MTIKHRHAAYSDQHQPTQGNRIPNFDPDDIERDFDTFPSEAGWEPDYEDIVRQRQEVKRPDWA